MVNARKARPAAICEASTGVGVRERSADAVPDSLFDSWVALGRPTLPYAEFRFRQGRRIREALDPSLIGRPANLLPADLGDRSAIGPGSPLLTIERKQALLEARPGISPKYLRIVNQWSTTC